MNPYNQTQAKRDQIRTMFNRIAPAYDMLNHLLSLGIDRRWRARVVRIVKAQNPCTVLDMATGTGDMAIAIARALPSATIAAADLSPQMLEVARRKVTERAMEQQITLHTAEAEHMPFAEATFEAATVAFGVRNFHDQQRGLEEFARVLTHGGQLYVLEFSTPRNKIFGALYRFYFHNVLPRVGGWLSSDKDAYRYLPESVDEFASAEHFKQMMRTAGFTDCKSVALTFGVAYIYIGKKI